MYFDLKRFRQDMGIKQTELCEVMNVSQGRVSQMEVGRTAVSNEKLKMLTARYGDCILDYKITLKKDIPASLPSPRSVIQQVDSREIIQNQGALIDHFASEIKNVREDKERLSRENDRLTWEIERLNAEIAALLQNNKSVDGAARSA